MKVLLLGASGLLGHNVTQQLLHANHEVVAVMRNKAKMQIQESHLQIIEGNLTSTVLLKAAKGCDAIINCAGTTDMALLHPNDYMPINRDLCHTLITTMQQQHITRLVHVSTANTIGQGTPQRLANEEQPIAPPFNQSWYALSKFEGEQIIQQATAQHPEWHTIIVNPGFMIGPYDIKPSSGALLLAGYHKPFMLAPIGGKSFVAVHDVAVAIVNALTLGHSGQRYLLTGKNMTFKEFYQLQSQVMQYPQKVLNLPNWIVKTAGILGNIIRTLHVKTPLATRNTNQLLTTEHYTSQKAITELHMPQTSLAQAIVDFYVWHRKNKNKKIKKRI